MAAKPFHSLLLGCLLSSVLAIHGGTVALAQTPTPAPTLRERVEALWQ
ncbi:MAG: hypothetical protein IGR92_08665 [Leptolyngbyaceae cyanobacterium T60_A2020_046]|nr:hypothetical protein [Leptolyngbyaceae cyanobacterium T60_A2020_046]